MLNGSALETQEDMDDPQEGEEQVEEELGDFDYVSEYVLDLVSGLDCFAMFKS